MSLFNTRKDRYPNGRAKNHRHPIRYYSNPNGTHYWKWLYTTKPRRAADKERIHRIMRGADPEGMAWSPDNYPTKWYW
ncbi:hypothetical protein [Mixta sp. Marseille-Q2659]|uniref:hypothetical protein n=1 Tax=Mixta sp. Marseille-Q2659 TaxID=2736607 RepID=UPI0023B9675E|nr:hypothetical protein [Mixta sp. Marseille-Q2659]